MFRRAESKHRRRIGRSAWAVLALGAALGRGAGSVHARQSAQSQPDPLSDAVVDYLEEHHLIDLVAVRLEATLRETLGDDRVVLAERLAVLYGQLLDEATTQADRRLWEERSRALLERVPKADTEVLRFNIHKASYLRAERTAELYRLRAVSEEERRDALRLMSEVARAFVDSHKDLVSRIKRLETSNITDARVVRATERELTHLHDLALQSAYYGAWALYYQAWLGQTEDGLDHAIRLFGWPLQFDGAEPIVEEATLDFVTLEHTARSILGIALCHAQLGRTSTALDWFAIINETDTTHERVRSMLPGYELLLLFKARRWDQIEDTMARLKMEDAFTLTLARLTAVLALTRSQETGDQRVRKIGAQALTYLAQEGAMEQVSEISDVFDFDALGDDSFAISYVLATKAYDRARVAHGGEEPTTDAAVVDLYRAAEELLRQTVARGDAFRWADASRSASMLIGMSLFYTGRFERAAVEFIDVARRSSEAQSEEAIWMAVVARDRQLKKSPDDKDRAQALQSIMDTYLRRFPSSARAGRLRLRRVLTTPDAPTIEEIDELLAIGRQSEAYESAQREAERRLYTLLRSTGSAQRLRLARRYLDLALPRLDADQRRLVSSQATAQEAGQYLLLARRVLDVLLMSGVARIDEARQVLDRIETARAAGLIRVEDIQSELDYRWFEIDLRTGDVDEAERRAASIWKRAPGSPYATAASRALFGYAAQDWRAFPDHAQVQRTLRRVVDHGRRSLALLDDGRPDLSDHASSRTVLDVGEAALELFKRTQDEAMLTLSRTWLEALVAAEPRSLGVLRAWANVSEVGGDLETAIDSWRTAMNGSTPGEEAWFESKYHLVRLLLDQDPERAREVLRQHVMLYPQYGPEPWGPRLRAIDPAGRGTGGEGGGG